MAGAHIHGHLRICGATTVVDNQSSVYVNGQLWAVQGTPNSHGNGRLINSGSSVIIEGKPVIINGDTASADDIRIGAHAAPAAAQGSGNVFAYG